MHKHYLKNVVFSRLQASFHASTPVNIVDETAPIHTNYPSKTLVVARGTTASDTWTAPADTENCDPVNVTSTHISSSSFPNGNAAVNFSAVGSSENGAAPCTFNIIIVLPCWRAEYTSICSNHKRAAAPFKFQRMASDQL
ncbi:MAG: HYR domain-containing protein [Saprospiraceae bacterium]|nr:HYR domain-containing protein [Saprospiraceae bacterium]